MKETLKYKGFLGSVEFSMEDMVLNGSLLFITDLITYEANSLPELNVEFEAAVDDYIATCKQLKREPMKPCSGTLNVRIGAELHQQVAIYSALNNESINSVIKQAVNRFVKDPDHKSIVHNHYHEAPVIEVIAPYPTIEETKERTSYVAGLQ